MQQAKSGDTVEVHYTGTLDDGTTFDSSADREPLRFTLGSGQVIDGFDQAIVGMSPGETKTEKIVAEEAYGPHRAELVFDVRRDAMPEDTEIEIGDWLEVALPDGNRLPVQISSIGDESVKLDANHPLAGKDLTFQLQLVSIQ